MMFYNQAQQRRYRIGFKMHLNQVYFNLTTGVCYPCAAYRYIMLYAYMLDIDTRQYIC